MLRKHKKKAPPYVSKLPKPSKPFSQLSSSELKEYSQNVKTYQKNQEVEFFGKEGAKRYKEAIRTSNSATATREEVKAANAIVDEMENSLSSEQKDDFFGINQAPGIYDPEEISKVAAQVGLIEQSENIQDLSKSLKNPLLSLSKDFNDDGSLAILNAAKKKGRRIRD